MTEEASPLASRDGGSDHNQENPEENGRRGLAHSSRDLHQNTSEHETSDHQQRTLQGANPEQRAVTEPEEERSDRPGDQVRPRNGAQFLAKAALPQELPCRKEHGSHDHKAKGTDRNQIPTIADRQKHTYATSGLLHSTSKQAS